MSTYFDMLDAVEKYYGSGSDQWLEIAKYGIAADNAEAILSQVPGVQLIKNSNGSIRSYTYNAVSSITSGSSIAEELNSNLQSGTASIVNNKKIKIPSNMGVDETGKLTLKSGMKTAGNFVFGEVVPAIAAAGVGISLGKTIDNLLYKANPDFWDSHGMGSINPDTWNSITSDDSLGSKLFNMVFGLNPDTGETQGYIDENAFAYLAQYLESKGAFVKGDVSYTSDLTTYFNQPIKVLDEITVLTSMYGDYVKYKVSNGCMAISRGTSSTSVNILFAQRSNETLHVLRKQWRTSWGETEPSTWKDITWGGSNSIYMGKPVSFSYAINQIVDYNNELDRYLNTVIGNSLSYNDPYTILYGKAEYSGGISGIGMQDGAITPDLTGATTTDEVLQKLKEQYPELWNNSIENEVVQPDGSIIKYVYVPIAMPEGTSSIDIKPVSGNATQENTLIKPDTSTQTLIDLITSIITAPPTNTDIPNTGSGDTPPVVIPSGSASALYSIYNPSQSELNNFGAWLWSSAFVDQLLKMFNDPMQSIIGLHKVFAQPIISGRGNIKVGYLDSGVNTNLVSNQYVTIDCGSVNIKEYFGNVFDYYPYTKIQLYLPFIGIVELDTSDTMRSSLNVKYHIDVLTGACLAEVNITRDSHGGILYTYNGNCAVQYPLSSGSYMGIVTGIISAGIGVAVGVSGNPSLGTGMALSSISGMRTDIKHSGNLSGNAGAMGIKKPYIIITRPQTHVADEVEKFTGYPSNDTVSLSNINGYVKVNYVHVEEIEGAFNSEKDEIERLLKEGVIIA